MDGVGLRGWRGHNLAPEMQGLGHVVGLGGSCPSPTGSVCVVLPSHLTCQRTLDYTSRMGRGGGGRPLGIM